MFQLDDKYLQLISGALVLLCLLFFANLVYERHQDRQSQFKATDAEALQSKIAKMEEKTSELKKAAELNPVWKNWAKAKDISKTVGLHLTPSKKNKNSRQVWVGTLSGDPLLVLATAKKIQQEVAAQLISMDYLKSSARLEIAVLGVDS